MLEVLPEEANQRKEMLLMLLEKQEPDIRLKLKAMKNVTDVSGI